MGRSRKRGRGNKNSKPPTKTRSKKEERKKQQKKQEALGADSTRKEKTKSSIWEKKENKKKILCIISKFCGETSRYWALFLKISKFFDSLQMLTLLKSDRLLVRNRSRLLMF